MHFLGDCFEFLCLLLHCHLWQLVWRGRREGEGGGERERERGEGRGRGREGGRREYFKSVLPSSPCSVLTLVLEGGEDNFVVMPNLLNETGYFTDGLVDIIDLRSVACYGA